MALSYTKSISSTTIVSSPAITLSGSVTVSRASSTTSSVSVTSSLKFTMGSASYTSYRYDVVLTWSNTGEEGSAVLNNLNSTWSSGASKTKYPSVSGMTWTNPTSRTLHIKVYKNETSDSRGSTLMGSHDVVFDTMPDYNTYEPTEPFSVYATPSTNSITLSISASNSRSYARTISVTGGGGGSGTISANSSLGTVYLTGLSEGTYYSGTVTVSNAGGGSSSESWSSTTTTSYATSEPFTTSVSAGVNSMTVTAYASNTRTYSRTLSLSLSGGSTQTATISAGYSTASVTFYGLTEGTSYSGSGTLSNAGGYYSTDYFSGTTSWDTSGNISSSALSEEGIRILMTSVPTSRSRNVQFGYKKSTDSYYTTAGTVSASGGSASIDVANLIPSTLYNVVGYIQVNGTTIATKTENVYTSTAGGSALVGTITDSSIQVNVTGLYTGTARTVKLYTSTDNQTWTLNETVYNVSTGSCTIDVTGCNPNTHYYFKVEIYRSSTLVKTTYCDGTTTYPSLSLTCTTYTEYSASPVASVASGVSYDRFIKWYYKENTASEWIYLTGKDTIVTGDAETATVTIDVLSSSTYYNFKAELYMGSGSSAVLGNSATASCTTNATAGTLSAPSGKITAVSIRGDMTGLEAKSYARRINFYYKRSSDSTYTFMDYRDIAVGSNATISCVVMPLAPETSYDLKADILKGNVILKTLTVANVTTSVDNSDVPSSDIVKIEYKTNKPNIDVYWVAPDHRNAYRYDIQYSLDDQTYTDLVTGLTAPPASHTTCVLNKYDQDVYIRIRGYRPVSQGQVPEKFSDAVKIYVYSEFEWDATKTSGGAMNLTATEWNRLVNELRDRLTPESEYYDELADCFASQGVTLLASKYNLVMEAIEELTTYQKEARDAVKAQTVLADHMDDLADGINYVVEET